MLTRELRRLYLDFFKSRGHLILPSFSLIPENDPSLLLVNAGMAPLKAYFAGTAVPPQSRIATCQKCVRTTDIEDVGDFSHCTFFEMLGNFSFGDYFKAEVIPWAWEFLTEWLKLDPDRLCVTIFKTDEEAFRIWNEQVGLPAERIHRLEEDKNFWPANAASDPEFSGPCGPCSEIFYRTVPAEQLTQDPALTPTERYRIDDKAGRWIEIWNLVFTGYDRRSAPDGSPVLAPLPAQNIDTGMGLDRVAYLLQGGRTIYDNDQLRSILARLEELSGRSYTGEDTPRDIAFRMVTEHVRSMCFLIVDGIMPDRTGAGYVLRRIMRRAILHGQTRLGMEEAFLERMVPAVLAAMGDAYPELHDRENHILATVRREEEQFRATLERGIEQFAHAANAQGGKTFSGRTAFYLYNTFGFPLDLTQDMAAERGMVIDIEEFRRAEEEHRALSGGESGPVFVRSEAGLAEIQKAFPPTEFVGYTHTAADAEILALLKEGVAVEFARPGDEVTIVLDRTPFYAEAGGPVGDTGRIEGRQADVTCRLRFEVTDTQKANGYWQHMGRVLEGEAAPGMPVRALVDETRRLAIQRNHTATHLLHAALRQVLGEGVHQAGSRVEPDMLRFDFTSPQAMTREQIRLVEEIVNAQILADTAVLVHNDVPLEEARLRGAMALFGEKYGSTVRMVEIPGFSLELCGGIHMQNTAQTGLFKIASEGSVSAGVRRITAVTGTAATRHVQETEDRLDQLAALLRTTPANLLGAAERLLSQRQELERRNRQLATQAAAGGSANSATIQTVQDVRVLVDRRDGADMETLANVADTLVRREAAVVVLGSVTDGKASFVAKVPGDLLARGLHAGNLVRDVARIAGGGGGGRPEFAQAGGKEPGKLQEALDAVPRLVEAQLGVGR